MIYPLIRVTVNAIGVTERKMICILSKFTVMKVNNILTCLFLLLIYIPGVVSQDIIMENQFTIEDGLTDRAVMQIIEDFEGKLWIITEYEIQIYDGKNFQRVNRPSSMIVYDLPHRSLLKNGNIAFCNQDSMLYILNTATKQIKQKSENAYFLSDSTIYKKSHQKESIILQDLYDKSNNHIIKNEIKFTNQFKNINGKLIYIKSDGSLVALSNQKKRLANEVTKILGNNKQDLWIQYKNSSIGVINLETLQHKSIDPKYTRCFFAKDKKGGTIIGLTNNPRRLQKLTYYNIKGDSIDLDSMLERNNKINDIYSNDFSKDLLTATWNGLIYYKLKNGISNITSNKNKKEGSFGSIIPFSIFRNAIDNELYITVESKGLFKIKNGEAIKVYPNKNQPKVFSGSNYFGKYIKEENLFIGESRKKGKRDIHFIDLEDNSVTTIESDQKSFSFDTFTESRLITCGHVDGKACYSEYDYKSKRFIKKKYLPELGSRASDLVFHNDTLYLGGSNGIFRYTYIEKERGLAITPIDKIADEANIFVDVVGDKIVAGTFDHGILIYKNGQLIKRINEKNGLNNNTVHSILKTKEGEILISTLKGFSILNKDFKIIANIDKSDGLSSNDLNQSSLFEDINGDIYIGTINGLNKINIDETISAKPKSTFIPNSVEMFSNGPTMSFELMDSKNVEIPYNIDSIALKFTQYKAFKYPISKTYLYENEFSSESDITLELRNDSKLYLSDIDKGKSKIKWNVFRSGNIIAQKEITIEKQGFLSYYKNPIIFVLSGLTILGLLIFSQKRKEKQNKLIESNKRDAKINEIKLHSLRSQMNPHFIFNSLGSIQYYIQTEKTEKAESYLSDFALLMRMILESSKKESITLAEEIDQLKLYVKLEQLRFEKKFDFKLNIAKDVNLDRRISPMIIQPFIENAIIHGLFHLKDKVGVLELSIKKEGQTLTCEVIDNGIGRLQSSTKSFNNHKSRGMQIIQERITLLSNSHVNLSIKTIDLTEPTGTKVIIKINSETN